MSNVLRSLPSVNELLESPPLKRLVRQVNQSLVTSSVRSFLDRLRTDVQNASGVNIPSPNELAERIAQWIAAREKTSLRPVINATGVLLHPELGGPPLADESIQALASLAAGYAHEDQTLGGSARQCRSERVERLLTRLTGAEAALVVNNGAAATLLTLTALATRAEVVVSRGQLIDSSDNYRLAEIIAASNAFLREVGSTNRTTVDDFSEALSDRTATILHVHTSNYALIGAVEEASLAELAAVARRRNLPLIADLGAGALIDFNRYGIQGEPVVADVLRAGADIALLCGDKLLGGPSCGIVVGKQSLVDRIARHPLARAVQADKLTLAALAATLALYDDLAAAERSIPLLSLLSTPLENLRNRAERLAPQIQATSVVAGANVIESEAYLCGAELPRQRLATHCIAITPAEGAVEQLAMRLAAGTPAVLGRIDRGRLLLDLRSVRPRHDQELVAAFQLLSQPREAAVDSAENS